MKYQKYRMTEVKGRKIKKKKKTYAISKIYAYLYVIIHLNIIIS